MQIAGRAFDEAKREALMMMGTTEEEEEGAEAGGEWDWFTMLGIERPKVRACVRGCLLSVHAWMYDA